MVRVHDGRLMMLSPRSDEAMLGYSLPSRMEFERMLSDVAILCEYELVVCKEDALDAFCCTVCERDAD